MIQILDTTSQVIRIKAVADIHWTAAWADSTATTLVEGSSSGVSSSGSDSDIVTSPAAGTRRIIKSITLYNSHASASRTVTLVFWDGSAERIIGKITLTFGSTWYSTDAGSSGGGSGVTDGDKGDIAVTNAGTPSENWTIDSGVVTLAKMGNLAPDRVIGRITSSTGVPEALTPDNLISIVNAATTNTLNFTRLAGVAAANHNQAWSTITSTPTTLSGYGITDALSNSNTSTQSGYFGDLYLQDDTSPSHYLQVTNSANLTAARTLALNVNDANRTISLSGDLTVSANATVSGTNTGDQTITLTGEVTGSGSGSFATTIADASVTPAKLSPTAQALSFRNFLINGDMGIRQRETSVAGIQSSGYYTVDRWNTLIAGTVGAWTQTSDPDGPSGQGFPLSLKMTCTTSNASLDSTDQLVIQQRIEGQNVQGILKGTSNAKQVTVSFWVKSGTTGTYIAELEDNDNSRYASKTYTINSANTWERKTLTFPADTTGALDNDNAYSLSINFWLVAGSSFTSGSLQSGWQTTTANRAASTPAPVNLSAGQVAGTNYWQITGVQLELGTTATEFERLSITTATLQCQRYYFKLTQANAGQFTWAFGAVSSADALYLILYPVAMRATPTLTMTGTFYLFDGDINIPKVPADISAYLGASRGRVQFSKGLLTAGRASWFDATTGTTLAFAIEL